MGWYSVIMPEEDIDIHIDAEEPTPEPESDTVVVAPTVVVVPPTPDPEPAGPDAGSLAVIESLRHELDELKAKWAEVEEERRLAAAAEAQAALDAAEAALEEEAEETIPEIEDIQAQQGVFDGERFWSGIAGD